MIQSPAVRRYPFTFLRGDPYKFSVPFCRMLLVLRVENTFPDLQPLRDSLLNGNNSTHEQCSNTFCRCENHKCQLITLHMCHSPVSKSIIVSTTSAFWPIFAWHNAIGILNSVYNMTLWTAAPVSLWVNDNARPVCHIWNLCRLIEIYIFLNSLRPSDAIWRQWFWTTLAQVMACCLTAPSHYLNQCWLIIRGVLWHTSESSFAGIAQGIDSGYEFEKDILKNIFKSPRGQWVNDDQHTAGSP